MATPARTQPKWILAAGGLALLWLAMLMFGDGPVDTRILRSLYVGHMRFLTAGARVLTTVGGGYFVTAVIALASLVLALRKRAWSALVLLVGTSIGRMLVELQKHEISRLRPDVDPHLVEVHSLSFPSAHSANAVLTYVTIALLFARKPGDRRIWVTAAAVLAFLVGLSRILLGVHWPSDVVGGWSFGLFWTMLLYGISEASIEQGRAT